MKIEVDVPDSHIENALCSAFDSGIAYWAAVAMHSGLATGDHLYQLPLRADSFVQLADLEGGRRCNKLCRATVHMALRLMAQKHPRHFADLLGGRHDATTGDALVQLAVFGEIVYG